MAITVNPVKRKIMSGEEAGQEKWYGQVVTSGKISFEDLCERISHHCTATYADVSAVLKEILHQACLLLGEGYALRLGRLGNLRLSAGSTGVENPEDFTLKHMKKPRLVFSPGRVFRKMLKYVSFQRLPVKIVVIPAECTEEHV